MVTGPAFQGGQLQSLKGRVLVPTSTWKAVYDPAVQGAAAYSLQEDVRVAYWQHGVGPCAASNTLQWVVVNATAPFCVVRAI